MANINIRVDDTLKQDAENIFLQLGLSMSAATNVFYRQVVRYGGIPFELRIAADRPAAKPARGRRTLENLFQDWDEKPEPYDWGELDAPIGRELL